MKKSPTQKKKPSDEEILVEAKARFKLAAEAESELRSLALDDLKFRAGEHWPQQIRAERDRDGRPCLVINRIPQFVQQITNDQRQNRPAIKVHPVDDDADIETAKIIQGLIRHIEYNSNADVAYDTAFDSAATGGFGYFRIITDYADPLSFEQEILVKRIRNPFSVYFDPHSQEPDGSDAQWAFVVDDLSHDEFKALYPKATMCQSGDLNAIGNSDPFWMENDTVRIAEYFYKRFEEREIALLVDGSTVEMDSIPDDYPRENILKIRKALVPVIEWCKLSAYEVLEKTTWPGKYIPIIPVYGTELYVDGKRVLEGIVRNAKDSQRMYNYWASAETEAIALAPRSPYVAAEGQTEDYEEMWETANRKNHSVLVYKPVTVGGQVMGAPQRQVFEPAVAAITNARHNASEDLKNTTGIYDASLGAKSNETSGIAIQRRNVQAQTSNFHFNDNLTRSLRHTGRVFVDLIPRIYDTARTARIIGDDDEQKVVRVNEPFVEKGKEVLYSLDAGKYDVTMDVGPSYASKRQEAVASMLEISKAAPSILGIAGDLIVKNMDVPGAQEIAERIKKTLPPNLQESDDDKEIPQQIKAQIAQMSQMIEQLTTQLNEKSTAIEKEETKYNFEREKLASNERIKMREMEMTVEIEAAKLDSTDSRALLQAEINELKLWRSAMESQLSAQGDGDETAEQPSDAPTGGESPGNYMEQ